MILRRKGFGEVRSVNETGRGWLILVPDLASCQDFKEISESNEGIVDVQEQWQHWGQHLPLQSEGSRSMQELISP